MTSDLIEVASGVDTLYVSIQCDLPKAIVERVELAREAARADGSPVSYQFGGYDWELKLGVLNSHRYRFDHPVASVGLTPSE